MKDTSIDRIMSITEFHRIRGLEKPLHPLISVVDYGDIKHPAGKKRNSFSLDFYSVSVKRNTDAKFMYGQQTYDFDEGVMYFLSPGQVFNVLMPEEPKSKPAGWMLLVHPDFLWNTSLGKSIKKYEYFDYSVNEALFLSEKEETILEGIVRNIEQEYHSNIDAFSQQIIVSQIETLLNYAERFYQRQFITRKKANHQVLIRLEELLDDVFDHGAIRNGLPTVQVIAEKLNVSPNYLSGLLKAITGQSTQQHIHHKLIEKAKEKLSSTSLSVSEIAYELGFEHPQSFSKLFKIKTNQSPLEFRASFN